MVENKIITTKVTGKNVVIEIPKEWIIKDFDEVFKDEFKVKFKNKFLNEFANQLREAIENQNILEEIYEQLAEGENVYCCEEQ